MYNMFNLGISGIFHDSFPMEEIINWHLFNAKKLQFLRQERFCFSVIYMSMLKLNPMSIVYLAVVHCGCNPPAVQALVHNSPPSSHRAGLLGNSVRDISISSHMSSLTSFFKAKLA